MSNVLLIVNGIGPAEGAIFSNLADNGHRIFTYHIAGQWIPRERTVPFWMRGYRTRISPMARNWFKRYIEPKNIDRILTSGLEAAAFAARNTDQEFYPLLWRGDLDFAEQTSSLTEAFGDLTRTSDRLLLEDPWEMDKAVSKGSQLPHFRMRYPITHRHNYLKSESKKVALIHSPSELENAEEILQTAQQTFPSNVSVERVNINSLYESADLAKGLHLHETLEQRLKQFSFAIFLGTGPHHSTVLRALRHDKERIVVDQTVGMSFLSEELNLPHRGRKLRCIQVMNQLIDSAQRQLHEEDAYEVSTEDYLNALDLVWTREVGKWYEELPTVTKGNNLNIFFSAAALEDRTTGARPQRIRNMHDAFRQQHDALNVFGSDRFIYRRLKLARHLIDNGHHAGVFYGENSTTPMTSELSNQVSHFLKEFSRAGGSSAWFVRDLHWLETFEKSPWSTTRVAELKSEGLHELETIGGVVDILAAPSKKAGEGFNQLLQKVTSEPRTWLELPPAVEPQNVVDDTILANTEGTTVLYSGGISEIYGMDLYLAALVELNEDILVDFVVREPEAAPLQVRLESLGLLQSGRARVLHTSMDMYRSRTNRTIGTVLLDSEYAKFSFPYKTVTMIERGYPILCYSDMAIADFVVGNELGRTVKRTPRSIRNGIELLISSGARGLSRARNTETWSNRVRLLTDTLDRIGIDESAQLNP